MKLLFTLVFALCSLMIWAQDAEESQEETFIETDSISNGSLSVTMDTRMDLLLEEKETKCTVIASRTNDHKPGPGTPGGTKPKPVITNLCDQFPKMSGYKIQILYSQNVNEVNKVRTDFAKSFPMITTVSSYIRPDFKVLAGEYFTRESASADLKKIRKKYPSAVAISTTIFCRRAK